MQCESEICDFGDSVMHEYVGNFKISMYNIFRGDILKSSVDVSDDGSDFCVSHFLFLLEEGV